jgi:hypothetical protein
VVSVKAENILEEVASTSENIKTRFPLRRLNLQDRSVAEQKAGLCKSLQQPRLTLGSNRPPELLMTHGHTSTIGPQTVLFAMGWASCYRNRCRYGLDWAASCSRQKAMCTAPGEKATQEPCIGEVQTLISGAVTLKQSFGKYSSDLFLSTFLISLHFMCKHTTVLTVVSEVRPTFFENNV